MYGTDDGKGQIQPFEFCLMIIYIYLIACSMQVFIQLPLFHVAKILTSLLIRRPLKITIQNQKPQPVGVFHVSYKETVNKRDLALENQA